MKWISSLVVALTAVCAVAASANATLISNGDGSYTQDRYDGSLLIWMQDPVISGGMDPGLSENHAYLQTYDDAMLWIASLNDNLMGGHNDWRLPSAENIDGSGVCLGFGCDSELGNLYYWELSNSGNSDGDWEYESNHGPFTEVEDSPAYYWLTDSAGDLYNFDFSSGEQVASDAYSMANIFAVSNGTPSSSPVPEPGTLLLLGSGMGMMYAWRRFTGRK